MSEKRLKLDFTPGYRTALLDGCLVPDSPSHMATEFFYPVHTEDYITCENADYVFAVATFSTEREDKYIYTYDYKTDSAWLTYRQDLTPDSYSSGTYVFSQDGYFRVCVKRKDGKAVTPADTILAEEAIAFYTQKKEFVPKSCFLPEIEDTVQKIRDIKKNMSCADPNFTESFLTLALLTDSHYTVNGTWEDTVDNIRKVVKNTENAIDGIVHLGDFTDGMTSRKVTSYYVKKMLSDLRENQLPVYVTLGNHDSNYFRGNKERLRMSEQRELFGLMQEHYYRDFELQKVRCLFLSSYDTDEPVRYGFSEEEVAWVKETLDTTPAGYKVLVFSHEAPLDILDYWARIVRNGRELLQVLEAYNARENAQILAFIHGHTHAEHIYQGASFPILSIGCNKCEYFTDKKPEGSHTVSREMGHVTQDLWDVLMVDAQNEQLHFVRFGAGEDRIVDCHKTESTWKSFYARKKASRRTKIWAHRGASGFAPENTLPAFEIAKQLDVDGIELDVQMTKDGKLVVIHDETIDRTGNGSGYVKDYTLEQLRQFNFAKDKPMFGFVPIPTLEEVYALFAGTDYVINVELKTNVIPYDGSDVKAQEGKISDMRCLEEKVHELTARMGMEERVVYSSFSHYSVKKMQQYTTKEKTAFLFRDGWMDVVSYGVTHQVNALHPCSFQLGLESMIQECHKEGMKVHVWTVNDEHEALRMRDMGVDAIITNHPGKMRELYYSPHH